MSDLLTNYFAELEQIQFDESQRLTVVLLSLHYLSGDAETMDLITESLSFLKEALETRKDLLAGARAVNKRKRSKTVRSPHSAS